MTRSFSTWVTLVAAFAGHGALFFLPSSPPYPQPAAVFRTHIVEAPQARPTVLPGRVKTEPKISRKEVSPQFHSAQEVAVSDPVEDFQSGAAEAAADPSSGRAQADEIGAYQALVRRTVSDRKTYPYAARSRRQEGRVLVSFELTAAGTLAAAPQVVESSQIRRLDDAAVAAVLAAAPFPPPPRSEAGWSFVLPLLFVLE